MRGNPECPARFLLLKRLGHEFHESLSEFGSKDFSVLRYCFEGAAWWQAWQLPAGKAAWFSGDGFSFPAPWHCAQSLNASLSIECGMAAGVPAAAFVSTALPAFGAGAGLWHIRHDSIGRP